jgi:cell surface protein SprA
VRDGGTVTGYGTWKLYRIPFRSDTAQVGTPDVRQVRALRMTVVAPAGAGSDSTLFFALARMRLVGAPWIKRAATPIAGLSGLVGQPHGEVLASVVGTEDTLALGYTPPPGVTNEGQSVGSAVTPGATQINEKSLRLVAYGVQPGERAEAFLRFPEGDRNFLGYREMRVWARGRGADWDANRLTFYIKVGQDENNFYLFRQNLRTTTWLPEAVIDFQRWFALRALVEERFLRGDPPSGAAGCGGDTLAYVACDGPYMVHVRNPGVAPPNLTRVQELAVGFVRDSGNALDSAEVWVDDIRLSQVVDDHGYAGAIDLSLIAADIGDFNLSMTRRDGNFRQLGENPAYTGTNTVGLASTIRLERLGLNRLGLTVPLTLRMDRASQDPYFVNGTDVLASGLNGLRTPRTTGTSWAIAVRRSRRGTAWWQRALTDNLGFGALWSSGGSRSELASSNSKLTDMRLDYSLQPADHHVPLLPGFLRSALDALPDFMRRTDLVRGLRGSNLRLTPATLSLGTNLVKTRSLRESYRVAIATPFDTVPATVATAASLRSNATLDLRPSGSLALTVLGLWDRDLKDYGDSTTMGALASERAQSLFGTNIGFVRQRSLTTRLNWNPPLASWLRARLGWSSDFALSRDPNANIPERTQGDSAGGFRLPTSYGNGTGLDLSASFDVSRLLRGVFGDSSGAVRILDRVTQLDVGRRVDMRSQFDRPGFDPGLSYMLGLTGFGGFRAQDSTLASSAQHQQQDRVNLVMRLPLNLAATGTYAERVAELYFLRGQSQQLQTQTEKEWPSLSMRWIWSPRTVAVRRYLAALNASVGYQVRSSANDQPPLEGVTGASLRSSQTTTGTPVSVSLTWSPGIVTSLSLTDDAVRIENVGNITRGDRSSKSADVSFQFRTPQEFLPLKSPVRATLRVLSSVNLLCVERVGGTGCTPIADSRHNEYNLTMDTDMPPSVTAGLSIGYVLNDDRHINRKFSQFTLTASARLYFSAGQVR